MHFAQPQIFNALWLLIPATFLFWALLDRKRKKIAQFAQPQLIADLMKGFSYPQYYFKFFLFILTFIFALIALARPQWGFEWQEIKRQGIDILVVIDTSKSMLTADVKPNRLERTKLAVKDLVKKLRGDRIGLIAFAGDAFLMCPLTVDYNGFLMTLDDLNTGSIPRGGTAVGKAIEEAMKSYEDTPSRYRAVIILTDGENLEGDPLKAAQQAQQKGVKVFCIGIGTQEGELIQVETPNGDKEFIKDEKGNFIKSRLNEELLQKIAVATGGAYVRASGAQFGLDLIYDRELSKMEKRDFESKKEKHYFERFQIPLSIALALLLLEGFLSPRVRSTVAVWIVLTLWGHLAASPAWAAPLAKEVNEGNRLYDLTEYDQALKKYQQAFDKEPNSDIINFNLGTALYRTKQYPQALEHLQKSLLTDDNALKEKTLFNLGNTYYRIGIPYEDTDFDEAIKYVEKALEQVNKALTLDKDDKDAQQNKHFFESEIRRLKLLKEGFGERQKEEQRKKKQQKQQQQKQQESQQPDKDQGPSGSSSEKTGQQDQKKQDADQAQGEKNKAPQEQPSDAGTEQSPDSGTSGDRQGDQKFKAAAAAEVNKEGLRPEDAEKFLQRYQSGEEPSGLLQFRQKPAEEKPVVKDW